MCKTLAASSSFPLSSYLTVLKHLSLAVSLALVSSVVSSVSHNSGIFLVSSAIHNSGKYRGDNKSIHVTQAKFTPAGVDKLNFTHRKDCSD